MPRNRHDRPHRRIGGDRGQGKRDFIVTSDPSDLRRLDPEAQIMFFCVHQGWMGRAFDS